MPGHAGGPDRRLVTLGAWRWSVQLDATSWVDVVRDFLPDADQVYEELLTGVRWQRSRVYRYEKYVDEPRMGGWLPREQPNAALVAARQWIVDRYGVPFDGERSRCTATSATASVSTVTAS